MSRITAERNQKALLELASLPGNDICADCKAKNPRWASHNLGIFICMTCASIHRKIGTHVTKVKSLTMDSWTKEQVEHMRSMGNIKLNAIYNPDELRHPPPPNMIDAERDSDLEKYIRSKYEFKSFFDRKALVASKLGPSRSASNQLSSQAPVRAQTNPPQTAVTQSSVRPLSVAVTASVNQSTPSVPPVVHTIANSAATASKAPFRSISQPVPIQQTETNAQRFTQPVSQLSQSQVPLSSSTLNDLISLQSPSVNASLPLQYTSGSINTPTASTSLPISMQTPQLNITTSYANLSAGPGTSFPSSFQQSAGLSPGGIGRSMSLNSGLSTQAPMPTGLGLTANFSTGHNTSPLQQSNLALNSNSMMASPATTPSPNPFTPQSLPQMQNPGGMGTSPFMGASMQQSQLQPNFTSQPFQQQASFQQFQQSPLQPQTQLFQPQSTMQFQTPTSTNPFMQQTQQTQFQTSFPAASQFTGSPSPNVMGLQGLPPHMQQQQQPQANQFTSWVQAPGTGGYTGQQWGNM